MKKKTESVTLKKVGYRVKGTSNVSLWGGGDGSIEMKPFNVKSLSRKQLIENINDSEFGVEKINSANLEVYTLYENGYEEYLKPMQVKIKPNEQKLVQTGIEWLGNTHKRKKLREMA